MFELFDYKNFVNSAIDRTFTFVIIGIIYGKCTCPSSFSLRQQEHLSSL